MQSMKGLLRMGVKEIRERKIYLAQRKEIIAHFHEDVKGLSAAAAQACPVSLALTPAEPRCTAHDARRTAHSPPDIH